MATSPVTQSGAEYSFSNHFSWFQGMSVVQPEAPNFALIYRHNIGYSMEFTVEDPHNEGYSIDVDHAMRGYITAQRTESVSIQVNS